MSTQPDLVDADQVRDHWWWRPGWHVGQRAYTWHLTFSGQHELHRLADQYRTVLAALPEVDPVPTNWLHLTMQGVGFADEVSTSDLGRIVEAVRARLASLATVALTFSRVIVFPEAVILAPHPAAPVHAIRSAIRGGITDVWGESRVPEAEHGFRAHVSVGYINRPGAAAPIINALDRTTAKPATVTVQAASLIELHRDHGIYQWQTVQDVPLGRPEATSTGRDSHLD